MQKINLLNNILKLFFLSMSLLVIMLFFCGCGDSSQEQNHPLYLRAAKFEAEKNYPEAIAMYRKFLRVYPECAAAHQKLGYLLSEYANDYANAVYHYRTCLELSPGAPDAETVGNFQRLAEEKFYQQLKQRLNDSGDLQDLTRQIGTLKQQLTNLQIQAKNYQNVILGYKNFVQSQLTEIDQLKKDKSELVNSQLAMQDKLGQNELDLDKLRRELNSGKSANASLQQQLAEQNNNVARLQQQLQKINTELAGIQAENIRSRLLQSPLETAEIIMNTPQPGLTTSAKSAMETPELTHPARPNNLLPTAAGSQVIYVEIKPSDTLGALAAKYLGSASRYNEILQANRDILKSPTDLRPGQRLKIRPDSK